MKDKIKPAEIDRRWSPQFGDACLSHRCAFKLCSEFKSRCEQVSGLENSLMPRTAITQASIDRVGQETLENHRIKGS